MMIYKLIPHSVKEDEYYDHDRQEEFSSKRKLIEAVTKDPSLHGKVEVYDESEYNEYYHTYHDDIEAISLDLPEPMEETDTYELLGIGA